MIRQPMGFMFDLDGTLILSDRKLGGYTAIPGAAEALALARRTPIVTILPEVEKTPEGEIHHLPVDAGFGFTRFRGRSQGL